MTQILAFNPVFGKSSSTIIGEASAVIESLCAYRAALKILAERAEAVSVHVRGPVFSRLEGLLNTKIGDDRPITHMRPVQWEHAGERGYHFFLNHTDQFPAFSITKRRTIGTEREFVLYVHGREVMSHAKIGPVCDRAKSHVSKKIRAQLAAQSLTGGNADVLERLRRRHAVGLKLVV